MMGQRCGLYAVFVVPLALFVVCATANSRNDPQEASRNEEIKKLLATVRDTTLRETNPGRVFGAIERLGELGDPAAVDDLVELLTFRRVWPWEKDPTVAKTTEPVNPWTWNTYPAVKALSLIGKPALPALIGAIQTHEPHSLETQKAVEVIIYLSVDKRPAYVEYLKQAAAKAPSPKAAERLLKAAESLKESKR